MKLMTVVGARPQFIKAAALSAVIADYPQINELIVHTGQHYDTNMSDIFFSQLNIPAPAYNLGIGSASHGVQTAQMLIRLEEVFWQEKPDMVMVYGDTNSTLAASLAATKIHLPIAHVEAGLRSNNMCMPEEINRLVCDRVSDLLFAPTVNAMQILARENLGKKAILSGDVMYDFMLRNKDKVRGANCPYALADLPDKFYLATIHRPQNTDNQARLTDIFSTLAQLDYKVVLPMHPRTLKMIKEYGIKMQNIIQVPPVSYFHMLYLLINCQKVLTDSGGLQKEAYFAAKPCITLRDETEWVETLENDWNILASGDPDQILAGLSIKPTRPQKSHYGNGNASKIIIESIIDFLAKDKQ